MKIKNERINAELARQVSAVIANDIKDPRMGDSIIGVTKVYTTPDLKYAKVYLSIFASDKSAIKTAYDTVVRSKSFIRNKLKDAVNIRLLPELVFIIDDSVDYGIKIDKLLSQIEIKEDGESE